MTSEVNLTFGSAINHDHLNRAHDVRVTGDRAYVVGKGGSFGDTEFAVRDAEGWKLHLDSGKLYHLHTDIEEEYDVADEHPETVDRLREAVEERAADLQENARPVGRVE